MDTWSNIQDGSTCVGLYASFQQSAQPMKANECSTNVRGTDVLSTNVCNITLQNVYKNNIAMRDKQV